MRSRLLGGRVTSAIVAGLIVSVVVGSGYAVASISGGGTIKACSQKGTHLLYTGKCKKGDKKLSWNTRGPQGPPGPGATSAVFSATGTASPTPTALGSMGPYTLKASCAQPSAGTTVASLFVTGPAGEVDGMTNGAGGGPTEGPDVEPFPALNGVSLYGGVTSTDSAKDVVGNWVWLPSTGGYPVDAAITIIAVGSTTNTCHISVFVTPASSSTSAGAASQGARMHAATGRTIP
jgi:hypothetical protein